MDLPALTLLNQPQSEQLKLSDRAQTAEGGEPATSEGFLQTLGEYLDRIESQEAAPNNLVNELSSSLSGNDLPVSGEAFEVVLEPEGKAKGEAKGEAGFDIDTREPLLAVLGELPRDLKNNSLDGPGEEETRRAPFFGGLSSGFKNDFLPDKLNLNNEQAVIPNSIGDETEVEVLKVVSDFLQGKDVKAKVAAQPLDFTGLMATNRSAPEKESFATTLAPSVLLSEQIITGKEQIQAMSKPLGHPDWGRELGDRISWMANKSIQAAELRLNPARLGPVEVHIQTSQEQASIMFSSPHASVREALEQALPRLREMMTAQQFEQVNVDVSQHSFDEKQASEDYPNDPREGAPFSGLDGEGESAEALESSHVISGEGLLSYYV